VALGDVAHRLRHRIDDAAAFFADVFDERGDLFRRFRRTLGQLADFFCDDGETSARFTGSRGFDRRVECEQVGLRGDVGDDRDDLFDLGRFFAEARDLRARSLQAIEDDLRLLQCRVRKMPAVVRRLLGARRRLGRRPRATRRAGRLRAICRTRSCVPSASSF